MAAYGEISMAAVSVAEPDRDGCEAGVRMSGSSWNFGGDPVGVTVRR